MIMVIIVVWELGLSWAPLAGSVIWWVGLDWVWINEMDPWTTLC